MEASKVGVVKRFKGDKKSHFDPCTIFSIKIVLLDQKTQMYVNFFEICKQHHNISIPGLGG